MQQNDAIDPSMRHVINSNFDTNNVVSISQTRERILTTLDSCAEALKEHCGPRSGYAMLIDDQGIDFTFQPSQFTRDGIRILKAIEYISPLERYIKNILTYVGERVDFIAKDGTTTSMLYAAMLLSACLKEKEELIPNDSLYSINKAISDTIQSILTTFREKEVITVDDVLEYIKNCNNLEEITPELKLAVTGDIAFMQAMSSSGGDVELALAMREIFKASPEETWEFIDYFSSTKETGQRYRVEVNDYDARIRCINASSVPMNEALGTEYVAKNADVIIFPGAMMQNEFSSIAIMDYLDNCDKDTPVILMATMVDGMFTSRIVGLNKDRKEPISIWQFAPQEQIAGQNYPWELMVLAAKCGVTPPMFINGFSGEITRDQIFKADVHWKDTYMYFYECIYRGEDNKTVLHPYYLHPETATDFYTQCVKSVEGLLKDYREGHRPDGRMYSHFMKVLNDLVSIKRPKLRIGGTAHEQRASEDVVQDVQGAIMSSLRHGFVVNGISNFMDALFKSFAPDKNSEFSNKLINVMFQEAVKIYCIIQGIDLDTSRGSSHIPQYKAEYRNNLAGKDVKGNFWEYLTNLGINLDYSTTVNGIDVNYPIMQPAKVTEEMLRRIQELVMKVVMTDKAIVYGGVMVKEDTPPNQEGDTCR